MTETIDHLILKTATLVPALSAIMVILTTYEGWPPTLRKCAVLAAAIATLASVNVAVFSPFSMISVTVPWALSVSALALHALDRHAR